MSEIKILVYIDIKAIGLKSMFVCVDRTSLRAAASCSKRKDTPAAFGVE